jgi:hypothetical protein
MEIKILIDATETYCQSGPNWTDPYCRHLYYGACQIFNKYLTVITKDKISYFIRTQECLDVEVKGE